MRLVAKLLALAATPFLVAPALAGDTAELAILGFSEDGGIFAFEEFGIQDGSGFPYANRFYLDTGTDNFLAGSPIRIRLDDESASLADARRQARDQGQSIVSDDELSANRGTTAGHNAVTEASADPHRMEVNPRAVFPPADDPLELRVEEIVFPNPEGCEDLGEMKGFRLTRIGLEPGQTAEVLHEDMAIPTSRRCPTGYRIGAVQTFFPEAGDPRFVVLIAVRSFGFEGPDHRWIAVPGKL